MEKAQFGAFIAQNRKQLGMTQKELAEKLYVTDKAVSKWERGLSYPDVTLLEPIAAALKMDVAALISCRPALCSMDKTADSPAYICREETSKINTLLDISKENLHRERRRHRIRIIPLAALLLIALAVCAFLLRPNRITETDNLSVLHTEAANNELLLYTEKDGHLLCLHYDSATDWDALTERIAEGNYLQAKYSWNRRTMQGKLLSWSANEIILGGPMDEIGSATDLYDYDGDALFGYPHVMMKIEARRPDSGGGYLSTYIFYAGDDSDDWYLHADEELLRVSDCLGYGNYGDIGFRTADVDDDGIRELLIRTAWPEKPCILYDLTNDGITETWLDDMPEIMSEPQ